MLGSGRSVSGWQGIRRGVLAVCCLTAVLAGCANEAASEQATHYVGVTSDGSARVAVVIEGDRVAGYTCGYGATLGSHTGWLEGAFHDSRLFTSGDGGHGLDARLVDGELRGELQLEGGQAIAWTAVAARAGTREGLYDAVTRGCRAGAIVWNERDDGGCEVQGSACDEQGNRSQITVIDCPRTGPLQLTATLGGKELRFEGERVSPDAP